MNFLRYPNNIFLIFGLITIVVIIYSLTGNNKIMEGVQNNEEKTKALNETIIQFTQDLYDKMKYLITTKTNESEDKTQKMLNNIDTIVDNIKNSNQVSPEQMEKWNKLDKLLQKQMLELSEPKYISVPPGIAIEIQNENLTDKIRGIINKYI